MGVVNSSIVLDGQREYVADILWVVPGPRSTLQGHLFASDGAAVAGMLVRLLRAGAEMARSADRQQRRFPIYWPSGWRLRAGCGGR